MSRIPTNHRNHHLAHHGEHPWCASATWDTSAGARSIGYVGATGDARTTHDRFEWHPWNIPRTLRVAPSGFSRILDGVDPFPFLNQVCRG